MSHLLHSHQDLLAIGEFDSPHSNQAPQSRRGTRAIFDSVAVALGMTTLCNLWLVAPLVSHSHSTVYHWSGTAWSLFAPVVFDFCLFWLVTVFLLLATERSVRARVALWSGFILFLPSVALKTWALLADGERLRTANLVVLGLCSILYLLSIALWRPEYTAHFDRARKMLSSGLSAVAMVGILILCELAWFGWQARSLNPPLQAHAPESAALTLQMQRPRVIWLVLDELSYDQVYGQRSPGLALPEFDHLAAQASVFSQVLPAGIRTDIVLPSLIAGRPANQIRSSADGRSLSLRNPEDGTWQAFNQRDTIFQDALQLGYRTGVAGWHNPYCRILPEVLDQCFWALQSGANQPYRSLLEQTRYRIARGLGISEPEGREAQLHRTDYLQLYTAADRMLADKTTTFLLIHMPIPHPGGIYNRVTGALDPRNSTYLDNLALSDRYLAHVRSVLEAQGEWDRSTIVVMGDHSWRTKLLWSGAPGWTPEEEDASHGGQFDDRPGYIVKLPYQHAGTRIDVPFAAVRTRALMDQLMCAKISSPGELSAWVQSVSANR